jgi:hypothetical protein
MYSKVPHFYVAHPMQPFCHDGEKAVPMLTIRIKTRLNPDGTLDLHIATDLPESEVEVVVVVRPVAEAATLWPAGFLAETSMIRTCQGKTHLSLYLLEGFPETHLPMGLRSL